MARKNKKIYDGDTDTRVAEDLDRADAQPADTLTAQEPPASASEPPAQQPATRRAGPKKRIRIRKKTAKHLSVAVLCNNSAIRRFI